MHEYSQKKKICDINNSTSEITKIIADVKKLLNSNDVKSVSSNKFSIGKFRRIPRKLEVSLPSLSPQKINNKNIFQQFGYLSEAYIIYEENYTSSSHRIPTASRQKRGKGMDLCQRMPENHQNYYQSYPEEGYSYEYPMVRRQQNYDVRYDVSGPYPGPPGAGAAYGCRNPYKTMEPFSR